MKDMDLTITSYVRYPPITKRTPQSHLFTLGTVRRMYMQMPAYASYIGWGEGWYCESALDTITKGKYLYSPVLWQTGIYVSEHTDQKPWRACMNDKIQRRSDCDELHDVTPATVSVYKCEERK